MKKIIPIITAIVIMSPLMSYAINIGASFSIGSSNISLSTGNSVSNSSSGQCNMNTLTLCSIIYRVIGYLNQALFLLIALSVVVFVWYVFQYFIKPNEDRKQAGTYVMYSIIGFFVILSMWGLVNILQNTFGLGNAGYAHSSWTDITNIFPR